MSQHKKPHNGRNLDGKRLNRRADVDDLLTEPRGPDRMRGGVRRTGAVSDIGPDAGYRAQQIGDLIVENRDDVDRVAHPRPSQRGKKRKRG